MNNSYVWIDKICERLFSAEKRRLDKRTEDLMEKNDVQRGKPSHGFIHMGKLYVPENMRRVNAAMRRKATTPPLAITLIDEAKSFIHDASTVERDEKEIRQLLFLLLSNCSNEQDIRNSLPECVVNLMPELRHLNRTLINPCYYIQSDWRAVRLYDKVLPRIEMYAMSHLLY